MPKISEHDGINDLKGSPFRDEYRWLHKQYSTYDRKWMRDRCLGLDLDFVEMRTRWAKDSADKKLKHSFMQEGMKRNGDPYYREWYIVCGTDIKKYDEDITPTEEAFYSITDQYFYPIIIIESDEKFNSFRIHRFGKNKLLEFSAHDFWNEFLPYIERYMSKLNSCAS